MRERQLKMRNKIWHIECIKKWWKLCEYWKRKMISAQMFLLPIVTITKRKLLNLCVTTSVNRKNKTHLWVMKLSCHEPLKPVKVAFCFNFIHSHTQMMLSIDWIFKAVDTFLILIFLFKKRRAKFFLSFKYITNDIKYSKEKMPHAIEEKIMTNWIYSEDFNCPYRF